MKKVKLSVRNEGLSPKGRVALNVLNKIEDRSVRANPCEHRMTLERSGDVIPFLMLKWDQSDDGLRV